ncbi:MAG TPA: hypothetical protein VGC32_05145 [Solirubrobacterales bacterium]
MAISAPKRSALQTAPGPSRTAPPEPKKRPRDRPRPGGSGRSSAAAPEALRKEGAPKRKSGRKAVGDSPIRRTKAAATAAPARKAPRKVSTDAPKRKSASASATAAPARKAAPKRKATSARAATAAPARKPSRNGLLTAPSRHKAAPRRRARVLPYAAGTAGRAAVAVTQLPESGLIHRLTRGRAWIGLLGVLLVGIVALNVVTLSFAASNGKVEAVNAELSKENSMLQGKWSTVSGQKRMRHEATKLGLALPAEGDAQPQLITARPTDVAETAARLKAAAAAANPE